MSILHTVNKSPFSNSTLTSCVSVCAGNDVILLLEDGVLGAVKDTAYTNLLLDIMATGIKVYALIGDVKARGLADKLLPDIILIDYPEFVHLSITHKCVQSWY